MQSVNFEYIKQLSGFEGLYNCCYEVECFAAKNPDISGCSILGNKDSDGNWNFLSGIDYVAYAPDLKQGLPVTEQLRVLPYAAGGEPGRGEIPMIPIRNRVPDDFLSYAWGSRKN